MSSFSPWTRADVDDLLGLGLSFVVISAASSGNNAIVAALASKRIKVISYAFVASGSVSAKWRSANTDLSGAMPFAANGGVALSSTPQAPLFQCAVNEALNLNLSSAVGVYGHLSYIQE